MDAEYRRIDEYIVRNAREQVMLRKIREQMNDLNHTCLWRLNPNVSHKDRRTVVYLKKYRRAKCTGLREKSRGIQLGISRRKECETRLAMA
jgi:hypothetical protein